MDQKKRDDNSSKNKLPIWETEPYIEWTEYIHQNVVRCTLCNKELQAVRSTLDSHAGTEIHKLRKQLQENKHQQSTTSSQATGISHKSSLKSCKRPRLPIQETTTAQSDGLNVPECVLLKNFELKLLLCSVIHSSTLHSDHTTEILSGLSDAQCRLSSFVKTHGKKCIEIMEIIAEDIREELCTDIGIQPYSIIINEYQWDNELQYWCLCIRYFSETNQSIVTNFFGLIGVSDKIPDDKLGELIIDHLEGFNLNFKKLIGFGAEAVNPKYKLLYESLKREKPTLLWIPFLPHSLNICFSRAVEELPFFNGNSLQYVWTSIYNHFAVDSTSSFRYSYIFDGIKSEVKEKIKNGVSVSEGSWLLGVDVIKAIIYHWHWLKKHFNNSENCQTRYLREIFNDDRIRLYFIIIYRILQRVHDLYLQLTTEDISIDRIYRKLYRLLFDFMRMCKLPERMKKWKHLKKKNFEEIKRILAGENDSVILNNDLNYGSTFREAKKDILHRKVLTPDTISEIENKGRTLIMELCRQIIQRFPANFEVYESLQNFSPKRALEARGRKNFRALPQELIDENNKSTIESQWNNLVTIPWPERLSSYSPKDFWIYIREHKNTYGEFNYRELADVALKALSLPFGNRNIEYIFSLTKSIETHIHEEIPFEVLNAIIRIRYHFFMKKLDCMSFVSTWELGEKLKTITCDGSCDPNGNIFDLINSTTSGLRMKLKN